MRDSLGSAAALVAHLGAQGQPVLNVAQSAFVQAIASTVLVGAGISLCGVLVALFFVPHRLAKRVTQEEHPKQEDEEESERLREALP